MAITVSKYYKFLEGQMSGIANAVIDFNTDTMKVSMHTVAYVPTQATDDFWDNTTNEVTGTNYTTKGATIGSPTITGGATTTFDGADVTWSQNASGFSNGRIGVLYKDGAGADSTDPLVSWIDFGASVGNTVADLVLVWNASGIITWT
jgi:hypothetical protein